MLDRLFMGAAADDKLFVEDVFSTYLYTGSSAQTITNGIDLAGKGGLVWMKRRDAAVGHYLFDTNRGGVVSLDTSSTSTGTDWGSFGLTYNSDGFRILSGFSTSATFASWTFRKAPKFFDVVTYTGDGSFSRDISHSLGVAPGMVIVKRTDTTSNWWTYHRGVVGNINGFLNLQDAFTNTGYVEMSATPAASFRVYNFGGNDLNASGGTYVAYVFAHDTASTGLIQCGSFTTNGSAAFSVNLGWEPQWVMAKRADGTGDWKLFDNMRGMPIGPSGYGTSLKANTSGAQALDVLLAPNATGFSSPYFDSTNATFVYIAIRRPMKTPTLGTSVFKPSTRTGTGTNVSITGVGFPPDLAIVGSRSPGRGAWWVDRLRGAKPLLASYLTSIEDTTLTDECRSLDFNGFSLGTSETQGYLNFSGESKIDWFFRRAPGFFDVVCYTGTGANRTVNHNLGVAPELIITKARSDTAQWYVHHTFTTTNFQEQKLNSTGIQYADNYGIMYSAAPTATGYSITLDAAINGSGVNFVAYLFASCPGVSKVGTYTGNGSSQTINCGFAAGARFVLIKRTDAAESWHVFDTARGINAGNDPALRLNSDTAEFTSAAINPESSGFTVVQSASCNNNVSGGTYIYLAIA